MPHKNAVNKKVCWVCLKKADDEEYDKASLLLTERKGERDKWRNDELENLIAN